MKSKNKNKKKRNKSTFKEHRSFNEVMNNYGVLLEILSSLPVKSLFRFKCVSKHWKTLISSDSLRKLHREKNTSSPPFVIAFYDDDTFPMHTHYVDYDPKAKINYYLVTSDLQGKFVQTITLPLPSIPNFNMRVPSYQSKLLFFSNTQSKKFYLYNPTTQQPFLLPNPSFFSSPEYYLMAISSTYGYIPFKDEYIIVHLVKLNDKLGCELLNVSISKDDNFKLHYGKWRSVNDVDTTTVHYVRGEDIFVGGSFYWQVGTVEMNEEPFFLSFDVENGCFSTFGYPADYPEGCRGFDSKLFLLDDELYLVCFPQSPDYVLMDDGVYEQVFVETPAILVLWKLSSDKESWIHYWDFDTERLFGFKRGEAYYTRYFRWEIFIYYLKYLKGYDHQPADHQVSVKMGELPLADGLDGLPKWQVAAVHTNLFTF